MAGTVAADFVFVPKVWSDHIKAYFNKKLVFGAFAVRSDKLKTAPGLTVSFPFYKPIGAAQDAVETDDLIVDKLGDDSFNAVVKEVGKAVSFTDKSIYSAADSVDGIYDEAQYQIGRVIAEKCDADIITELNTNGNYVSGFTAGAAGDVATVSNLFTAKTLGFGDKANETAVIFLHSLHYLSIIKDSAAGFLKADANDPMFEVGGFMGRLFGAAVVVTDTLPAGPDVGGKKTYYAFMCKPGAYGLMAKQDINFEKDRDILGRETVISATEWYAVKAFHAKSAATDLRILRALFATEISA